MTSLLNMIKEYDEEVSQLISEIYAEYEKHESKEAKYVKSLDLIDMYLQAYEYEHLQGKDLDEFFSSAQDVLDSTDVEVTSQAKAWIKEIIEMRNRKNNILPADSNLNTILKDYFEKQNKNN